MCNFSSLKNRELYSNRSIDSAKEIRHWLNKNLPDEVFLLLLLRIFLATRFLMQRSSHGGNVSYRDSAHPAC